METRKGRLIPNLNPLAFFYQENARSPFEGELAYDSEDHIGFWAKNQNNVWEFHVKSKDIQDIVDGYGELGDNTFQNAQAFYENNVIHRFYFNQVGQKVWLDNSVDVSKFAYYAILGIGLDKGSHRYVTGLVDSDGSDFEKALIPTSRKYGTLTKDIKLNTWYTVEFYNSNKEKAYSVNYLAYQSFAMPIDLAGETEDKTNTITGVSLTFNQVKNGKGILYIGQPISELKPRLILTMADRHQVIIDDVSKMNLKGLDAINNSEEGEYTIRAEYNIFGDDSAEASIIFKTFKETVLYLYSKSSMIPVTVTIPKNDPTRFGRVYKEVRVRGIGDTDYTTVADYTVTEDNNGNDVITIPYNYFKLEKNNIIVSYTEQTEQHVVDSKSLHVQAENTLIVTEKPLFTYKRFYSVGYVESENGVNVVKYKFFILTDEDDIVEITDITEITYPDEYASGRVNRMIASFNGRTEIFFSYFRDVNSGGSSRRVLTSSNQNELLTDPDITDRPLLLCTTLQDESLRAGIGTFTGSDEASFAYLADNIALNVTDVRIRMIRNRTMFISDYAELSPISIAPFYKEFRRLYNRYPVTVAEEGAKITSQPNYVKTYRLVKYKNITVSNKPVDDEPVSNKTLKELLQVMPIPVSDFGTFIGYSLNNVAPLTEEEENKVIKAGTSLHIFAFFAESVNESYEIPGNFPGHLEIKHTLNRSSIRLNRDDPLLVEGYTKTSDGQYKCLGAVVCHVSIR